MSKKYDFLTKEEIKELGYSVKTCDIDKIFQMALKKYNEGQRITRVHDTRSYINMHNDGLEVWKYKIRGGSDRNKSIGVACFSFALLELSDGHEKNFSVTNVPGISTKHKFHGSPVIENMLKEIDTKVKNYKLKTISGLPDELEIISQEKHKKDDEKGELNRSFKELNKIFSEVLKVLQGEEPPIEGSYRVEEKLISYLEDEDTLVEERRMIVKYDN